MQTFNNYFINKIKKKIVLKITQNVFKRYNLGLIPNFFVI